MDKECKACWNEQILAVEHGLAKGKRGVVAVPFKFEKLLKTKPQVVTCKRKCCMFVQYCFKCKEESREMWVSLETYPAARDCFTQVDLQGWGWHGVKHTWVPNSAEASTLAESINQQLQAKFTENSTINQQLQAKVESVGPLTIRVNTVEEVAHELKKQAAQRGARELKKLGPGFENVLSTLEDMSKERPWVAAGSTEAKKWGEPRGTDAEIKKMLQEHFGHQEFKPLQREAINAGLADQGQVPVHWSRH